MADHQDQRAGSDSIAIQGGRDVTVGFTNEQVIELIRTVLAAFTEQGRVVAADRMAMLEAAVLPRFADGGDGRREAFADPDFQAAVKDAAEAFARSGEESLQEELANLLVERSKDITRSRRSLVLNQAIKTAGLLTSEEIGAICVNFALLGIHWNVILPEQLASILNRIFSFALARMSSDRTSLLPYLESIGVGSVIQFTQRTIVQVADNFYPYVLSDDFTLDEFNTVAVVETDEQGSTPGNKASYIYYTADPTRSGTFRFGARNRTELEKRVLEAGALGPLVDRILNFADSKKWSAERIQTFLEERCPQLKEFTMIWEGTELNQFSLTAVGMTLGYSQVRHVLPEFQTPIEEWVR